MRDRRPWTTGRTKDQALRTKDQISALHVGQLLGDLSVAHAKDVHSSHMSRLLVAHPSVGPADDTAIARGKDLLGFEVRLRRATKELFPVGADGLLAADARPVRSGPRVLEHAVRRHPAHDGVHVVAVEGLVEPLDSGSSRV